MSRFGILIAVLTALAVFALACGGGDDDNQPSVSARTATPDGDGETATPGGDGDKDTPEPEETTSGDGSPNTTQVRTLTPAAEGTPAVAPQDQSAFLAQFADQTIDYADCVFNPSTAVTDCSGDKYAVDPPLSGQDVNCQLGIVDGKAELIRCTSAEPLTTIYYDIQG